LVEIEAFLTASGSVRFVGSSRVELYKWVERLLCHHEYSLQGRRSKGLLRAYFERMAGFSRAQPTRLFGGYGKAGRMAPKPSLAARFQHRYTAADVELLASVGEAHDRICGPVTRHILKREFERLARLSNGHLYILRRSSRFGLRYYQKSRPKSGIHDAVETRFNGGVQSVLSIGGIQGNQARRRCDNPKFLSSHS
jgi:hypothetical protein